MPGNTDVAATVWLTELDDIDISWNTTTFACSRLGRLPTELLDGIVKYVPTSDLPAVARISWGLRGLAEQYLYTEIDLNRKSSVRWLSPVCYDRLWILYRTLGRRPDLAQTIRTFSVTLFDEEVSIDPDTSSLFPGDIQLSLAVQVSLKQILIGSRVWQLLTNLKGLQMTINRSSYSGMLAGETLTRKEMTASNPLSHLLPTFNHATAHTIQHPGLQKLTRLEFGGAEFHWALAKSPSLRKLRLTRPCVFLSDEAPEEVNASLKVPEMEARSAVLRKHSNRYAHLQSFLARFPALEELTVRIFDLDVDILYNSRDYVVDDDALDYTNLLDKISAVAAHLVELDIGVYTNDDDEGDDEVNFHLSEVRPSPGFQQFKALKSLIVPYQCLLGCTFSSVDALPSPAAILPPGLDTLDVHCPQIYLYDWLARLQVVRDRLPLLQGVRLYCQSPHGDTADLFEYVHHDHRGVQVLDELGIGLWLSWHVRDEKEEWNDYDLNMLQAVEWIESLGS